MLGCVRLGGELDGLALLEDLRLSVSQGTVNDGKYASYKALADGYCAIDIRGRGGVGALEQGEQRKAANHCETDHVGIQKVR